jgi:Family of unknown function (DUF6459)
MSTATEVTATAARLEPPPAIRLRPVPRCDPPFDDELPAEARVSADQLILPWSRPTGTVHGSVEDGSSSAAGRAVPTGAPGSAMPSAGDARLAVRRFVGVCVEVLNGYRPAAHLRRLAAPVEAPGVVAQGVAGARRVAELRQAARPADRRGRRPGPVGVLRVLLCEPRPGAVEAAVLLVTGERTWAMAFRLEFHQQKWAATALRLI